MTRDKIIDVIAFGQEIGKLGYDIKNLFPFIFKSTKPVQIFTEYHQDSFQGLPPMIADSLPDTFGNIIFQEWLTARGIQKVTPLEQLAYVANRGIGAIEYRPVKELPNTSTVK